MGEWAEKLLFPEDAYLGIQDVRAVLFFFVLYSCLGWMLEHAYHRFTTGRFADKGFLSGPYKPMYGFAPVILLVWIGPSTPWWWTVLLVLMVPTLVEYASGYMLRRIFLKDYWNYSGCRFQLDGLICMKFSLYWAILCTAVLYGFHPLAKLLYGLVSPVWRLSWGAFAAVLLLDLAWTIVKSAKERMPVATK
jgi:uncharacterized membrane protein